MSNQSALPEWSAAYAQWHVKDAKNWCRHAIETIPPLKGIQVGMLTEEEVEKLEGWHKKASVKARQLLAQESQRNQGEMALISDVTYIGYAIAHLEEWKEHQEKRSTVNAPASTVDHRENTEKEEKPEPKEVQAVVNRNGEIVDPRLITSAQEFIAYVGAARRQLATIEDFKQLETEIERSALLRRLAAAINTSKEAALQATAYEIDARYQRHLLIEIGRARGEIKPVKGGKNKPGKSVQDLLPEKTDQNWESILRKWSPEEYHERVKTGLETQTLSQKTFEKKDTSHRRERSSSLTNHKKDSEKPNEDTSGRPLWLRPFLNLCVEVKSNHTMYPTYPQTEGDKGYEAFLQDEVLMQNFMPIAQQLGVFIWQLYQRSRQRHPELVKRFDAAQAASDAAAARRGERVVSEEDFSQVRTEE